MPMYRWAVPQDSVSLEQRAEVALAFTDIHCGGTGAPRNFVHVVFEEREPKAGRERFYLDGFNRAGRPQEVKDQLLAELLQAFQAITGAPHGDVGGRIIDGPAKWTMEGGMVLPEPGEETAEWYEHDQRIAAQQGQAAAGG